MQYNKINNYFAQKIKNSIFDKQYVLSPYSISYITLLVYLGSTDDTKKELANLFGINYYDKDEDIIGDMIKLDNKLSKTLKIANGFFIEKKYFSNIKESFYKLLKKVGKIDACDFANNSKSIISNINNWVSFYTNGLINEVISNINPLTQMILINVIYFKSNWKKKFKTIDTYDDIFYNSINQKINVKMMYKKDNLLHYADNDIQMIEIPYKENYSMGIILGKMVNPMDYMYRLMMNEVKLYLPKFRQEYEFDVVKLFKSLGVNRLFNSSKAELYNIIKNKDGLYVDKITHKAVIIVDEEGTEAAAVTVIALENYCAPEDSSIIFKADHTFQYYIKDNESNTIIFMGMYDGC